MAFQSGEKLNQQQTKTKGSLFRKMRHEVTLKSEILSQLDFKSAPQDVVFNCLDGQVLSSVCILHRKDNLTQKMNK